MIIQKRTKHRAGLTLVELLVVLVILAVLTTIAVTSLDYLADQARFDATQRTLQNVQDAIIGPGGQRGADGSVLVSGFVADMGRLPLASVAGTEPLRELWDPSVIAPASKHGIQTFTFPDLKDTAGNLTIKAQLPCGWRGPYVQLPMGSGGRLLDGWGNPLDVFQSGTLDIAVPGNPIQVIRSRGEEYQDDISVSPIGKPYAVDQYVPSQNLSGIPVPPLQTLAERAFGKVQVNVQAFNAVPGSSPATVALGDPIGTGSEKVRLVLFAPVNGVLTPILPDGWPAGDVTLQTTPTPIAPNSFLNVSIGTRAVQAFQYDSDMKVTRRSPLTNVTVAPTGGTPTITLIMQ